VQWIDGDIKVLAYLMISAVILLTVFIVMDNKHWSNECIDGWQYRARGTRCGESFVPVRDSTGNMVRCK